MHESSALVLHNKNWTLAMMNAVVANAPKKQPVVMIQAIVRSLMAKQSASILMNSTKNLIGSQSMKRRNTIYLLGYNCI